MSDKRPTGFDWFWKHNPPTLTQACLSRIPHTPAGDALYLEKVELAISLDKGMLAFLEKEAPKRSCYLELQRLMLKFEGQRLFARQKYNDETN